MMNGDWQWQDGQRRQAIQDEKERGRHAMAGGKASSYTFINSLITESLT